MRFYPGRGSGSEVVCLATALCSRVRELLWESAPEINCCTSGHFGFVQRCRYLFSFTKLSRSYPNNVSKFQRIHVSRNRCSLFQEQRAAVRIDGFAQSRWYTKRPVSYHWLIQWMCEKQMRNQKYKLRSWTSDVESKVLEQSQQFTTDCQSKVKVCYRVDTKSVTWASTWNNFTAGRISEYMHKLFCRSKS